jgi:hypothetical protein
MGLRAGLGLAALAVAMLAFAGSADAKKHKKKKVAPIVTATATVSTGAQYAPVSATATCPAGTNAVGGGFSTPPLPPSPNNAFASFGSHKVGSTQWTANGVGLGTGSPIPVTVYAYCRKGAPVTTPVVTTISLPVFAGAATVANASCPVGQVLMSGGFSVTTDASNIALPLSSNRTDPGTWQVTAATGFAGLTMTSQADCASQPKVKKSGKSKSAAVAKKKKKTTLVPPTEVTGSVTNTTNVTTGTATAPCPVKTFPVVGGFNAGDVTSPTPSFNFISASQAVGSAINVSGYILNAQPATLKAYGYCIP